MIGFGVGVGEFMGNSVHQNRRASLLTDVERPSPAKAGLLTRRESVGPGPQIVRMGITKSGLLLKQVTEKDHGQASREIDGKEKLDFHEMIATWPPEVWCELLPLIALEVCPGRFVVERTIAIRESLTTLKEKSK